MTIEKVIFKLYVAGQTGASGAAIVNFQKISKNFEENQYHIEIIDIHKNLEAALNNGVLTIPTLVKLFPIPERRVIGDLSNSDQVIYGLGIISLLLR